jgi:hypothetical protein
MAKRKYNSETLVMVFRREKILCLDDVFTILGTSSRMTIYRILKNLNYQSSYSHRGKYYTIPEIPRYDENGLWSYKEVHFSKNGTLINAIIGLVRESIAGHLASELESILKVNVQNAILKLHVSGKLDREQIGGEYVYYYPTLAEKQRDNRKQTIFVGSKIARDEYNEHLRTFLSVLNEKQRRLYLGFESLKIGHGGDIRVASEAGVNVKTVARGRKELLLKDIIPERIRQKGAGRLPLKKKKF